LASLAALANINAVLEAYFGPLDPAPEFRYWVEIDGLLEGTFTECSGFKADREIIPFKEGGVNDYVHKLPGRTSFSDITLRKGVMFSIELWKWFEEGMVTGKIKKRNITIIHHSSYFNIPARWYHIKGAYPAAWEGPNLRSDSSQLAVEALTLTFESLKPEEWDLAGLTAKLIP
jgi:phage tail-like protein